MPQKVILSADSTCDLSAALIERYQVHMYPLHILLEGRQYADGEISPDALYEAWWQHKQLPKTSAITPGEYVEYFRQWVEDGYQVVHINLGSNLSSAYQNCCIAAEELGNVYPVDSCNLSTGMGLLVIEAAERIAQGMDGRQIQQEVNALRPALWWTRRATARWEWAKNTVVRSIRPLCNMPPISSLAERI